MAPTSSFIKADPKRRIIAVGGAKGGVGKSLMAANLGVYLAAQGHRTVVIDLDLGAANLHLYLGVWALKHRINDYLDKKVGNLESIAVDTRYGPRVIGGGSSRLGSPNLPFVRKLKLIRAIRRLEADYIILDLGADTSYNILDFFLLADSGLVMTTCDPAAYLDAYTFIKMALYRRLIRLFGPESGHHKRKDESLQAIIREFIHSNGNQPLHYISDLLDRVQQQTPDCLRLIEDTIGAYRPNLVVNMVDDQQEAQALIQRMQKVSQRMLSIRVSCAGTLARNSRIARSTHDLKPEVAIQPDGVMARHICQILAHTSANLNAA